MEPKTIMAEPEFRREQIRKRAVESLRGVFPFVGKRYTLDVENVKVKPASFTPHEHKKAILQARTMAEPVRGTLVLKDAQGKVLERVPKFNLLQLPYFTDHGTFVIGGATYSVANQLRMKPGVYTRKRKNEELEASFNLAKGDNFRLSMDPEKGHFKMEYGTTRIPLYPILKKMGVSDTQLSKHWNSELVRVNREAFDKKADTHVGKLYDRIVNKYQRQAGENKVEAIHREFDNTAMDPNINKRTLGKPFDKVDTEALLAASGKLLRAFKEDVDFDERDSLAFKKLMTVDDFIGERIDLEARDVKRKALLRIESGKADIKKAVKTSPFTRSIHRFLSTSQLSTNPDQINPVEMLDQSLRVTSMGEGGIENFRAIPQEARRLHTSHVGVLDPVRTPENERVGIDLRTTLFTAKDENGDMYLPVWGKKGRTKYVPVSEIVDGTLAFPGQKKTGKIDAVRGNKIVSVPAAQVDYTIPTYHGMYSPASNLIPFMNSIDGNRGTMGSKMQTQALPLKDAEAPLIQVAAYQPGRSMEDIIADFIVPTSPVAGTVSRIKDGFIYIKEDGKKTAAKEDESKIPFFRNFPLASKTYLDHRLRVKVGDKVKKGQKLADDTFVRDGQLALGKNLRTAYLPWRGLNSNDAIVVSDGAAKKLTSLHMYKKGLDVERDMRAAKEQHRTYFGNMYTSKMYDALDKDGTVKPGAKVSKGDLLIAALRKSALTPESAMLGKLHKSLVRPYRDSAVVWDHDTPGEITDVVRTGKKIRMTIKTEEPLRVGDKLSGSFGNKGVVSTIVPDEQMLKDEQGRTIDMVLTPAGIVSRINPAQILETALAKVAEKTGKPIRVDNYVDRDNVAWVKQELKKHGIKDKETVFDPITGKSIPGVLVGPQHTLKLFKSTETNYSARGVEDYDVNQQPSGGGPKGAKGLGTMEVNALLAHGAPNILREAATLKSQRNDEFWRAYQLGLPLPEPKTTFSYDKFGAMLTGAGVRVNKSGNYIRLAPLTDSEIMRMAPQKIKKPLFVRAKDLRPETDGLFDPAATGGTVGTKWCFHYTTYVLTNRGLLRIGDIVTKRLKVKVLSLNPKTGQLEYKRITAYWKTRATKPLVGLMFNRSGLFSGYKRRYNPSILWSTETHEVYTPALKKRYARAMSGKFALAATHNLTSMQKQLILGSLLGDAWLEKNTKFSSFACTHGENQKNYLELKKRILGNIVDAPLKPMVASADGKWKERTRWQVHSIAHNSICELSRLAYRHGKKMVSRKWLDQLDARGLAFWYMDDGSLAQKGNKLQITLCTHGFTKVEVCCLRSWLKKYWQLKKVGMHQNSEYRGRDIGWALTMTGFAARKFLELVAPYIPKSMQYKVETYTYVHHCKKCGRPVRVGSNACDACVLVQVAQCHTRREYQKLSDRLIDESSLRYRYGSWSAVKRAADKGIKLTTMQPKDYFRRIRELTGSKVAEFIKGSISPSVCPVKIQRVDKSAKKQYSRATVVYNIGVEGYHNYFANGILVGNSHVSLAEPIINPVFEKPVQTLLGMTKKELEAAMRTEGGRGIRKRLAAINTAKRRREVRARLKKVSGAERDRTIKELKYLEGLKKSDLSPDKAYVLSKIPVVPPVFRPVLPGKSGDLQVSDANYLYRDLMLADDLLRKSKDMPAEVQEDARKHVYDATKALFGLADAVSPQARGRNVKGFIANIAGTGRSPKVGFFQSKLLKKKQDITGRGTIVPDATLHMDEVGLPEEMGWDMYKPFVVKRMVQRGFNALDARDKVEAHDPVAKEFLDQEVRERPAIINRAPSLRRYNVLAAYPKLVPGKSIRVHELLAPIMSGDHDGDTVQIHVPVQPLAVEESKKLILSNMLLGDQYRQQTNVVPQHEAVAALYDATKFKPKGPVKKFKTKGDAMKAYHSGEITLTTPVEIKK